MLDVLINFARNDNRPSVPGSGVFFIHSCEDERDLLTEDQRAPVLQPHKRSTTQPLEHLNDV